LRPEDVVPTFDRLSDLTGGGGGGDGRSLFAAVAGHGTACAWTCEGTTGVGGTMAVDPLLVIRLRDGGFASRDKLR
jgi:hypothetical protein